MQFKDKTAARNTLGLSSFIASFKVPTSILYLFTIGQNKLRRHLNSFIKLFSLSFNLNCYNTIILLTLNRKKLHNSTVLTVSQFKLLETANID